MTQKKKVSMRLFRDVYPGTRFTLVEKRASSVFIRTTPRRGRVQRHNARCVGGILLGQRRSFPDDFTVYVLEEEEKRVEDGIVKKLESSHFSRPSH